MDDEKKKMLEEKKRIAKEVQKQKNEMRDLINKYPKQALQGTKLKLDANWKKGFVGFLTLAIINLDLAKKTAGLGNQISDKTNEALDKGTQIPLTEETKMEIMVIFRIKNLFNAGSALLGASIPKLNAIVIAEQPQIDEGLYHYYVGARANLEGIIAEQNKQGASINKTLAECFRDAIREGLDLEELEKEATAGIDTKGDITRTLNIVYESLGLNIE